MTRNKARKRLVRQRSAKTGESYSAALRQLLATKETPVKAAPTVDTPLRCTLCDEPESPTTKMLAAGGTPICRGCDERFRVIFRAHLEPVADSAGSPLDQFMSAIAYFIVEDHWKVDLHTFRPGLVIGSGGATVGPIRRDLVKLTGDERLQLNLVEHGPKCAHSTAAATT